jgi:mannosyltransferase
VHEQGSSSVIEGRDEDHSTLLGEPPTTGALHPALSRWSPLLVGVLAFVLGLVGLGTKSLWFDEAYDAVHATDGWEGTLSTAFGHEASQAAYLVALKLWLGVVPDSEFWTRLPSVLSAALAAGLLVALGARLLGTPSGVIAGLLLTVNGFVLSWSQQARTYTFVMLLVIASSYLLVRALEPRAGLTSWTAYAVVATASIYAHFFAGFVIAAQAIAVFFARPRPRPRDVAVASSIIACGALPALWFLATKDVGQIDWIAPLSLGGVKWSMLGASGSNALLLLLGGTGSAILLLRPPIGVDRSTLALIVGWALLPLIFAIVVSIEKPLLMPRYLIVAVPGLALLGAVAISSIRIRALAYLALAATLVIGFVRVVEWYDAPSVEDWRGAVAFVEAQRRGADQVFVGLHGADEPYRYYSGTRASTGALTARRVWIILGAQSADDAVRDAHAIIPRGRYRSKLVHARAEVFVFRATVRA